MPVRSLVALDRRLLARWPLPDLAAAGDKEARGTVLVIGGARQMPGPVILSATAALRAGAGRLQIATVASVAPLVATAVPEALVHGFAEGRDGGFSRAALRGLREAAAGANAILMGPGTLENQPLAQLVRALLRALHASQTLVLDAGALTVLADAADARAALVASRRAAIITPHAGEMARLLGLDKAEVQRHPRTIAERSARDLGVVTVLKGAETFVSDGTTTCCNRAGNVGLATSGSGDTLAGITAGLAARGAPPLHAAAWAVHLHARAGEVLAEKIAPLGYLARELIAEIPALLPRPNGRPRRRRAHNQ